MTTRSGPISAADFLALQVLAEPSRGSAPPHSEHASTASKTCRSAELGRVGCLMQPAREMGVELPSADRRKLAFIALGWGERQLKASGIAMSTIAKTD
jgi:hypothetical protein